MKYDEKTKRPLRTKTVRVILIVSLIFIIVGSAASLALYAFSSLRSFKKESNNLLDYVMSLEDEEYIEKIFKETKDAYYSLPEEARRDQDLEIYGKTFGPLIDDDYDAACGILSKCRENMKQRNVFLMFPDPGHDAAVYVLDGDEEEWAYLPGQWTYADLDMLDEISRSSWRLIITHESGYGWIGTNVRPIYDKEGGMIGYAAIDLDISDFISSINRFLLAALAVALAAAALLGMMAGRLLDTHIISHLTGLAGAAREYTARDNVAINKDTPSVFAPLGIETGDEIEELWRSMTGMEADVKDSMIRLREITSQQERLEAELSIAKEIQEGVLPGDFPDRAEFALDASMEPAKEVGGDLYDFFMIDDDHLALVIADVSGKGISAALFMVIAKTLIKNQTEQGVQDPGEIFARVNEKLREVNKASMFVTAWLGILELSTGRLEYVNAGHEYPAIQRAGGLFALEEDVHCAPLASFRRAKYKSGSFMLGPGDALYLYTDGVAEANITTEDLFGYERMLDALNKDPDADPKTINDNVKNAISDFVKDEPQFDDTTMLCLRFYKEEKAL